jgi:hypothetical protein
MSVIFIDLRIGDNYAADFKHINLTLRKKRRKKTTMRANRGGRSHPNHLGEKKLAYFCWVLTIIFHTLLIYFHKNTFLSIIIAVAKSPFLTFPSPLVGEGQGEG